MPKNKVVAFIFFTDGKRALLLKRATGNNKKTWGLPGGRVDEGETPFQAAVRESKEEVGQAPGKRFDKIVEKNGRIVTYLFAVDKPFDVELNREHSDYEWVKLSDFNEYNLHPAVKRVAAKFLESVRTHFKKQLTFREWLSFRYFAS